MHQRSLSLPPPHAGNNRGNYYYESQAAASISLSYARAAAATSLSNLFCSWVFFTSFFFDTLVSSQDSLTRSAALPSWWVRRSVGLEPPQRHCRLSQHQQYTHQCWRLHANIHQRVRLRWTCKSAAAIFASTVSVISFVRSILDLVIWSRWQVRHSSDCRRRRDTAHYLKGDSDMDFVSIMAVSSMTRWVFAGPRADFLKRRSDLIMAMLEGTTTSAIKVISLGWAHFETTYALHYKLDYNAFRRATLDNKQARCVFFFALGALPTPVRSPVEFFSILLRYSAASPAFAYYVVCWRTGGAAIRFPDVDECKEKQSRFDGCGRYEKEREWGHCFCDLSTGGLRLFILYAVNGTIQTY